MGTVLHRDHQSTEVQYNLVEKIWLGGIQIHGLRSKHLNYLHRLYLKIIVFYIMYYTSMADILVACLEILSLRIFEYSFKTLPDIELMPATFDSSPYIFNLQDTSVNPTNEQGKGDTNADLVRRMELDLQKYENTTGLEDCSGGWDETKRGRCIFPRSELGDCQEAPFGYIPKDGKIQPCFFLKLDKIYGFNPDRIPIDYDYNHTFFEGFIPENFEKVMLEHGGDNIYFNCYGRYPDNEDDDGMDNDQEYFSKKLWAHGGDEGQDIGLEYFPKSQSFSRMYLPYMNEPNYHQPMVAVKINNPPVGRMMYIECFVYHSIVIHDIRRKEGLIQFKVLIQ